MNVQALRRAGQQNNPALRKKSTETTTAILNLNKWGTSGSGASKR